jgi:hypothetical protein
VEKISGKKNVWWGQFKIPIGQIGFWRIGTMALWIQRFEKEWRIGYQSKGDPNEDTLEVHVSGQEKEIPQEAEISRFSFRQTDGTLSILPVLADRPVITRPETHFSIPSGEEIILFVGSPLWVKISVGSTPHVLKEFPIYRPSDTWFGPSTREGELCYATRTQARLKCEEVSFRPNRAVTPVLIRNQAKGSLSLERINLPVLYLSLFEAENGFLWTEPITFVRKEDRDQAAMEIPKEAPREAIGAQLVVGPREKPDQNLVIRAFSALFGG